MDIEKKDNNASPRVGTLDRRSLMKMSAVGAGVAVSGILNAPAALAQATQSAPLAEPSLTTPGKWPTYPPPSGGLQRGLSMQVWPEIAASEMVVTSTTAGYTVHTGAGWKNTSGRASGNGPMDEVTRRMVDFAVNFDEKKLSPKVIETFNYLMADTLGVLFAGFESEPARISARLCASMRGDMKCTVLGYGIVTTPEMAAFTNGSMIRHTDFNAAPHDNELLGGILAIGEALHVSGLKIIGALVIAYEVVQALDATRGGTRTTGGHVEFDDSYHSAATALAVGWLMGMNADQMANAVSLALLPHMPLYSRIGVQTMWKGCHSSEMVRTGVWGALLAKEGMTGPPEPFEGRDGLIAHLGPFIRDFQMPSSPDGQYALEVLHGPGRGLKRFATEGTTETLHEFIMPPLRAWAKADEIASIEMTNTYYSWQEISDPTKWDPRNRETSDHSMPYNIARSLMDGYIYYDSFTREKYMDPKVRELMAKITIRPNPDPLFSQVSLNVTKKSGEQKLFVAEGQVTPMTHDEIVTKYHKSAEWSGVEKGQADRILQQWMNLKDVKDIGDAIATVAKFGSPKPLSDKTPSDKRPW